jgi:hypothetical protein
MFGYTFECRVGGMFGFQPTPDAAWLDRHGPYATTCVTVEGTAAQWASIGMSIGPTGEVHVGRDGQTEVGSVFERRLIADGRLASTYGFDDLFGGLVRNRTERARAAEAERENLIVKTLAAGPLELVGRNYRRSHSAWQFTCVRECIRNDPRIVALIVRAHEEADRLNTEEAARAEANRAAEERRRAALVAARELLADDLAESETRARHIATLSRALATIPPDALAGMVRKLAIAQTDGAEAAVRRELEDASDVRLFEDEDEDESDSDNA